MMEENMKISEEKEFFMARMAKIYECEQEERERQKFFENCKNGDLKYSHKDDVDLTEEQMEQLRDYWKKYEFAVPLNPDACKTYTNRTGKFDVHYTMYGMKKLIRLTTCPDDYKLAFQNKGYLEKLFSRAKMPVTLVRRVNGINLNSEWKDITSEEVADICESYFKEGRELVMKVSASGGGGLGVSFLKDLDRNTVLKMLNKNSYDMVIQEPIEQHPFMSTLNPSTVNTIRMTTFIVDKKAVPLAALVKVGNANVRVDNFMHGGHLIGMNLDGTSYTWALNIEHERVNVLPTGVNLSDGIRIPFFKEAVEMACESHLEIAKIRMVSWDICITPDGPMIIEGNFGGDLRMHQALSGPIFGEYSDQFFDEILVKSFCKHRANWDYDFDEYRDYVVITKYAGNAEIVHVPRMLNGKPVRRLAIRAFYQKKVRQIVIPEGVRYIGIETFRGCYSLRKVELPDSLLSIGKEAFKNCKRLHHIAIPGKTNVAMNAFDGCEKLGR